MSKSQHISTHDSFIEGQLELQKYQGSLLNKVSNAKEKIDKVDSCLGNRILDEQFVVNNKQLLKSITWDFDILGRVLQKLQRDNMYAYEKQRDVLIRTIKQQIKRYRGIIPSQIIQNVTRSRLRNPQIFASSVREKKQSWQADKNQQLSKEEEQKFVTINQCFKQYIQESQEKIEEAKKYKNKKQKEEQDRRKKLEQKRKNIIVLAMVILGIFLLMIGLIANQKVGINRDIWKKFDVL